MDDTVPRQNEVIRLTNLIVKQLGICDMDIALTVVCGLAGQLVAQMSESDVANIEHHTKSLAKTIAESATRKLIYDASMRKDT